MLEAPCFNRITKTDCPDRKAGCAVKCEKWALWEKEKALREKERAETVPTYAKSSSMARLMREKVKKRSYRY